MKNLESLHRYSNRPTFTLSLCAIVLVAILLEVATAQTRIQSRPTDSIRSRKPNSGGTFTPQGGGSSVHGSGTAGMIPKWLDSSSIGDSIMSEASGKIGIGTPSPGSTLSVVGMIETTLGGYKFPDGTIQTTAASGGMGSVAHDSTLTGNGTSGSPLGVAVPLNLTGAIDSGGSIIKATNTAADGYGVEALGGASGVFATGGNSSSGFGGNGVTATGGNGSSGTGGHGVFAQGGSGSQGGAGITAQGGSSDSNPGGRGGSILGGRSTTGEGGLGLGVAGGDSTNNSGGVGVNVGGGIGSGAGHSGGIGIAASGGIGLNGASPGLAGSFIGDVVVAGNLFVTGTLSKGGGSFKIDHPLDPENKYLYHSFVESPDMMNIYNGNVVTDENGEAVVKLPDYFEALNFEFRYQLTVIGQFAQAIVSRKIRNNEFAIKTSAPGVEVSWQVTGVRRDAWANKNRIPVEEAKPERERGSYLHPEVFNQPEEKGVAWSRNRELMKQRKPSREAVLRISAEQRTQDNSR